MNRKVLALIPCVFIGVGILIFYVSGAYHWINFETIQQRHLEWKAFVEGNPFLAALIFMGAYIVSVLFIIPDATILTLLGGFLFPLPLAIVYTCVAETIGATLFFLAARLAYISLKRQSLLHKMHRELHAQEVPYLLFLRFSHLLPFWVINLGAGLFRVKPWTFIWTTLVGVLPLTFFLAQAGESLSTYFETHTHFSLKGVFTPTLKLCFIGLGCIALLPILYRKLRSKR